MYPDRTQQWPRSVLVVLVLVGCTFAPVRSLICDGIINIDGLEEMFQQVGDFSASAKQSAIIRVDSIGYAWGDIITDGLSDLLQDGNVRTVSIYDLASCVINDDYELTCLGPSSSKTVTEAPTDGTYASVTVGEGFACAIKFDSSYFHPDLTLKVRTCDYAAEALDTLEPVCWGEEYEGPSSNLDVATALGMTGTWDKVFQVRAGEQHTCFQTFFGNVSCGGRWSNGAGIPERSLVVNEYPTTSVALIASGANSACFIMTSDSTVSCHGDAGSGATVDVPDSTNKFKTEIGSLAVGARVGCAINTDEEILCWGFGAGFFSEAPPDTAVQNMYTGANAQHFCARRLDDNSLTCWGVCNLVQNLCDPPADAALTPCELVSFATTGNCLTPTGVAGTGAGTELCNIEECTISGSRYQLFGGELCLTEKTSTFAFTETTADSSVVICEEHDSVKYVKFEEGTRR